MDIQFDAENVDLIDMDPKISVKIYERKKISLKFRNKVQCVQSNDVVSVFLKQFSKINSELSSYLQIHFGALTTKLGESDNQIGIESSSEKSKMKRKINFDDGNEVEKRRKLTDGSIEAIVPESPKKALELVKIDFRIGEVVWAKIKGFPCWPAKIKAHHPRNMATVIWFNDYRTTKVFKSQLFPFLKNFDQFAKQFDNSIGLKTAAQEALMYYGSMLQKTS